MCVCVWGGFPCGLAGKEFICNVGDLGLISGLGGSPGEGIIGYSLQYSCPENFMDKGDWQATTHGVGWEGLGAGGEGDDRG